MTVISISLPEKLLEAVDEVLEREGYSSRSEFIRNLIRSYLDEKAWASRATAYLVIVLTDHNESVRVDEKVIGVIHRHQALVKAFYHQLLGEGLCLNIAVVDALPSSSMMLKALRGLRGVKRVWIIPVTVP